MTDLKFRIRELIDEHQWQQLRDEAWESWLIPISQMLLGLSKKTGCWLSRLIPGNVG